ncbi:MAG: glycosyl hydrolase family 28-related protein [Opitutales bacterium]
MTTRIPYPQNFVKLLAIGLMSLIGLMSFVRAQDVLPDLPDSGVLNVKDFGAKGDGVADDLPAIQAAIKQALDNNGRYSRPPFIYFPAGTYLLSDSLEGRVGGNWSAGWRAGLMLMGEERSKVTLQLADNHPGFQDPEKPRAVLKTGSESDTPREEGWGNRAFRHNIFNLTVDTGKGNPGAIGIDFLTNNRGAVRNVTIRSGDPEGVGAVGLAMNRQWPGPGLIKNVRIEGFDVGIETDWHGQYSMTFERIELVGQKVIGIDNNKNGLFIEKLDFMGDVPALRQRDINGLTIVIDSRLESTTDQPVIQNAGNMLLRNVEVVSGAPALVSTVKNHEATLEAGRIDEWLSHPTLGEPNATTLNLPVKTSPEYVNANPDDWQNAAEFVVEGEDPTAAIQRALDAGKPVVYFPNGSYTITRALVIPPEVRRITGMQSAINPSKEKFPGSALLQVTGGSEPLIVEHFWFSKGTEKGEPSRNMKRVLQDSARSVVFRHCDLHGGYENTARGTGDVFFEDNIGVPLRIKHPQSVWGRQVNCEFISDEPMIQNNGGTVWLMGYKTEGQQVLLDSRNGDVEVLGGLAYALGPSSRVYDRDPMFRLAGGRASISIAGNGNRWSTLVTGDETLTHRDAPGRGRASMILLYRK